MNKPKYTVWRLLWKDVTEYNGREKLGEYDSKEEAISAAGLENLRDRPDEQTIVTAPGRNWRMVTVFD